MGGVGGEGSEGIAWNHDTRSFSTICDGMAVAAAFLQKDSLAPEVRSRAESSSISGKEGNEPKYVGVHVCIA